VISVSILDVSYAPSELVILHLSFVFSLAMRDCFDGGDSLRGDKWISLSQPVMKHSGVVELS
jgi:hypothetical protein